MRDVRAGTWIMAVGVLHQAVGLLVGWEHLVDIAAHGGFATVTDDHPFRLAIFWFFAFGFLIMVVGSLARTVETAGLVLPRSFALTLAGVAVFGVFFMPLSGFWTMFAVAALVWQRAGTPEPVSVTA